MPSGLDRAKATFTVDPRTGDLTVNVKNFGKDDLLELEKLTGQSFGKPSDETRVQERHLDHTHVLVGGKEVIRYGRG